MNISIKVFFWFLVLAAAGSPLVAAADGPASSGMNMPHMRGMDMSGMHGMPMGHMEAELIAARGKVNSIDVAGHKVNITHEAIESLDWPSMTMDFQVPDDATLKGIKAGETVDFWFEDQGPGRYVVRKMRPVAPPGNAE
ncbi:MAG: copper-binding protein [Nevskiaceae bacterium]|nr:MAG: copper-binding protein [Nevskiaceae bacterium]TBR73046.1 MAG: copper-binding protein [Nevskiaceae bacterium]